RVNFIVPISAVDFQRRWPTRLPVEVEHGILTAQFCFHRRQEVRFSEFRLRAVNHQRCRGSMPSREVIDSPSFYQTATLFCLMREVSRKVPGFIYRLLMEECPNGWLQPTLRPSI